MKKDVRRTIVEAAIRLINEKGGNPGDITVRDICAEAGVGVGMINYHFQTKDNLIAQCVQLIIGNVIGTFEEKVNALPDMSALDTLKTMFNSTATFLYSAENISRISILTDHQNPKRGDNTAQTMDVYYPLVEKACRERGIEKPLELLTMLIQSVQGAFLRTDVIREELGVDLRNEAKRREFINGFIDAVFSRRADGPEFL